MQSANFYRIRNTIINLNHVLAIEKDRDTIIFRVSLHTYQSLKGMYSDIRINEGNGSPFFAVKFSSWEKAEEEFDKLSNAPVIAEVVKS